MLGGHPTEVLQPKECLAGFSGRIQNGALGRFPDYLLGGSHAVGRSIRRERFSQRLLIEPTRSPETPPSKEFASGELLEMDILPRGDLLAPLLA